MAAFAHRISGGGRQHVRAVSSLALIVATVVGCATARFPEADLSSVGWTVRTGQAVWRPGSDRPPVAGEVILARHTNGDVLVNFSKPPLSIFTARTVGPRWSLDIVAEARSHAGRGSPPRRFVWFFLPQILDGSAPPRGWTVTDTAVGALRLQHLARGETIDLVLDR